jgi:hypothetical protein
MPPKGQIVKQEIFDTILKTFPGSFQNDKEIRINVEENGVPVQIKITATAVKTPISNSPKNEVINEGEFFISDDEKNDLAQALTEMGVEF